MPRELNWWIGVIFAMGSLLFVIGSMLSLSPLLAQRWSLDSTKLNAVFFAGSIPFTTAAYLQLFQSANAAEYVVPTISNGSAAPQRVRIFGWRPDDIGWLSCAFQFVGTLLFNINTYDAMAQSLSWIEEDLLIWAPDIIGSTLFLASGYLACIETCHAYRAWEPDRIDWWIVFINLLGCAGFMTSAIFAIFLPGAPHTKFVTISVLFTLFGASGFLVGSLLMLPESISSDQS